MVRALVAVFFVCTVAGVTVAGGAVSADQSRSQLSVEGHVDRTLETGRQVNAQRSVDLATVPESRVKAAITSVSRDIPLTWVISFAVLVLVLVAGSVVYRSDIRTKTADETDTITSTISKEDLISDEDRVLMLLQDNDGRMRQANIVHETDWSKSKVSMVLSEMDDEDLISKLRIGRENIISITGDEPEAARSPFEDE